MENTVTTYVFQDRNVRVFMDEKGDPWWVGKDVCDILDISNYRDAISRLDEDEKGVGETDTLGGAQQMSVVSESGLYNLIFRSNKPEAKTFRRWVTHEVLPAIRKTGQYSTKEALFEFNEQDGLTFNQRIKIMDMALKVLLNQVNLSDLADTQRMFYRTVTAKPFSDAAHDARSIHFESFLFRCCKFEDGTESTTEDIYSTYFKDANSCDVRPFRRSVFFRKLYEAKDVRKFYSKRSGEDRKYMISGIELLK